MEKRPRAISYKANIDNQVYVAVYDTFSSKEEVGEMEQRLNETLTGVKRNWRELIGEKRAEDFFTVHFHFDEITKGVISCPLIWMKFARKVEEWIEKFYCQKEKVKVKDTFSKIGAELI